MFIYIIVVFGTVVLTSALLLYILFKMKLLNYRVIAAVSFSSMLVGISGPGIFTFLCSCMGGTSDVMKLSLALTATLVLFIILVLLLSVIITMLIPENAFSLVSLGNEKADVEGMLNMAEQEVNMAEMGIKQASDGNYIEEIYNSLVVENNQTVPVDSIEISEAENNLEKSVDSEKNIDKMGLEAFEQDIAVNLSVEDCIEEAFRLKATGDFEGAILYFMYALDKKPDKGVVFWIILDICVLYKSLGQIEFAKQMLSSYYETYSDLMDAGVKDEIERNLASIDE